jgi:hypothetical protein
MICNEICKQKSAVKKWFKFQREKVAGIKLHSFIRMYYSKSVTYILAIYQYRDKPAWGMVWL